MATITSTPSGEASATSTSNTTSLYHDGSSPAAALTTVFSPPASCSSISTWFFADGCMPPKWDDAYWDGAEVGYYSPGICPSGYTGACERPAPSTDVYGPPLETGETATMCCPFSFQCVATYQSYCTSASLTAYAVQVRWQSSDLPALETNPVVPIQTGPAPILGANNATATNSTTQPAHDHAISTAAKAGIGVGGVVIAVLGAALLFLLWRQRKRNARPASAIDMTYAPAPVLVPQPVERRFTSDHSTSHTPSNPPVEVPADPITPEDDETRRRRLDIARLQEKRARMMRLQEMEHEERSRLHNLDRIDDEIARAQAELDHRMPGPTRW